MREAQLEPEGKLRVTSVALAQNAGSDRAAADAALASFITSNGEDSPLQVALVYALRNERDKVFEWLNHAYAAREPFLLSGIGHPILKQYHSDPRFVELCGKLNIPVPQ